MTVSSTTSKVSYSGNGSTVAFSVTFYFLAASHLKVVIRSSNGTETVKTLGTHYTVAGDGDPAGGTVTMLTAPASGETIVISRNVPLTQVTDYQANDPFPAETHEAALDKLTQINQQIQEELTRAIKLSVSNTMTSTEFTVGASARANKVLGFDSAGELAVTQEIGTYRGNWASGTAYQQRDIIKDTSNANIYICVTAHTSSGSQPISSNTDSAKWALLVDAASAAAAQAAAEAAQAAAETAQAAAELAETNAETAETNAETAETNAETAATNAASSASAAATSATNASNSATAAATSATNASNSATAAATAKTAAELAETNAETAETNAETAQAAAELAETNAETAATNAAASATLANDWATKTSGPVAGGEYSAKYHANAASSSASAASTSASNASTSATNASNSASAADASAVSAAASAAAAAASYDSFDDRYLGAKSSAPSVDNDGNALVTGALYYNTTTGKMNVYDGGTWIEASAASQAILVVYQYTATGGQTTFTGTDNNALTLGYTVGSALVTLNGVMLEVGSEVTASSGTSVVLASGATAGDELNVYAFSTFNLADVYTKAQSDAKYVELAGDTMTGELTLAHADEAGLKFKATGTDGTTAAKILFEDTAGGVGGVLRFDHDDNSFKFATAGDTERMRLDSSGRLLVNRTATGGSLFDACKVQVTGNLSVSGSDGEFVLQNTGTDARVWRILSASGGGSTAALRFYDDTAGAERMRIDTNGRLLIGLTSLPTNSSKLNVGFNNNSGAYAMNIYHQSSSYSDSALVFYGHANATMGYIYCNGSSTQYATSSDYRLKENIAPMTGALAKVAQLKPCTYTWKETGKVSEGFIAHELQEVIPDAVSGEKDAVNEDGSIKPQGIDTSFLVATLTAAIQEQQAIITDLKARIETLENK